MATLNGITIKNIKKFKGHEGEPLAQGNVYIDGKKAGFWSMDNHGGPDTFDAGLRERIEDRAALFAAGYPKDAKYAAFQTDPDIFMGHLLALSEDEKEYKKRCRQNASALYVVTDGYRYSSIALERTSPSEEPLSVDEIRRSRLGRYCVDLRWTMFPNETIREYVYNSLEDFVVTVDADHPAPVMFIQ